MKRTLILTLLLLLPGLALVSRSSGQDGDDNKSSAGKWEYLVVAGPSSTNLTPTGNPRMRKQDDGGFGREAFVLQAHLDKLGARGWELVSVSGSPADPVYYFKRRK